MKSYFAELA